MKAQKINKPNYIEFNLIIKLRLNSKQVALSAVLALSNILANSATCLTIIIIYEVQSRQFSLVMTHPFTTTEVILVIYFNPKILQKKCFFATFVSWKVIKIPKALEKQEEICEEIMIIIVCLDCPWFNTNCPFTKKEKSFAAERGSKKVEREQQTIVSCVC